MADLMHKAEIQAMVRDAYRAVIAPNGAGRVVIWADMTVFLDPQAGGSSGRA